MSLARIAILADPHMNANNIGYSIDYKTHSLKQFRDFIDYVADNNITHVIIAGDFWHGAQTSQKYVGECFKELKRLKDAVNGNLYAIRGNHEKSSRTPYTLYDLMLDAEFIKYQHILDIGSIRFIMFNYCDKPLQELRFQDSDIDEDKHNIGIYHNNIVKEGLLKFPIGDLVDPDEVSLFRGLDLAVIGHIHAPLGLFESKGVKFYIPGSQGRTQLKAGQQRSDYILPIIDIDDTGDDFELQTPALPLVPENEFFSLDKALEDKKKKVDLENFTNNISNIKIDLFDAVGEIEKSNDIEDSVKKICYMLLGQEPTATAKKSVDFDKLKVSDNDSEF